MDGFLTLIILVIIFNLFSAIMRAIKGGSSRAGKQRSAEGFSTESQISRLFSDAKISDPEGTLYSEFMTDPEVRDGSDLTSRLNAAEAITKLSLTQETSRTILFEPAETRVKTADQDARSASAFAIKKVFTEKDSFLAAFVLHEILDSPPALRRRGRL